MAYFKELPSNPNFPEMEREILSWWQENDIVNKYLHKNDDSSKIFSFIDGPITANAPMGVHHARGRTIKDVFQRYKNLAGFQQRFQNGFDCQGLWVEVEVEKDAGFNSKKDIINFGLEKFTNACLDRVSKYSQLQTEQSKRLGYFMDWDNSYYTNSKENNLYIWHFFKLISEKGWLVKRKSAATWCPRCETGLSQHEQADGYKNITDTSVYLKFKLKNKDNEYVLAWTTTPWTLSANVLLAINTKFEYVKAKYEGSVLYLARLAADRLKLTDYESIDAQKLVGLEYEPLYDIPAQNNIKHHITNWKLVDPTEGTGIVHIAPGCGQEDFELGKVLKAPMPSPLDETGHFTSDYGDLSGLYAHDVAPLVFEYLKRQNLLFKTELVTHRYPHCWRCHTKCLFRLEDSWYIDTNQIRPLMKKAAATVNWHPKFVGRRMQNWLDSMEDWMISRKRFYGLSLPFYECDCGQLTVVGSLEELEKLAIDPKPIKNLISLHRPWIDEIKIKCSKCGQSVNRVPDVGDCWLDAGIIPFSTLKYLSDKNYWRKWFPAELVTEMTEQVRLWFYSLLFFSVTFENTTSYQNVVTYAEVRDEHGERMSKTKKNGLPFDDAVAKMSADAMRWLYCLQKSSSNVNFGYRIADSVKREFILILWNSYRFFTQHANLENWHPNSDVIASVTKQSNILDLWLLSRLNSTINQVTKSLDKYSTAKATKNLQSFVTDLSTWYIRRSRTRSDNLNLLYYVFRKISTLISPFIPFLSETIHRNLSTPVLSVHLENWPKAETKQIDSALETQINLARKICQLIHAERQSAVIKIRQPLSSAAVTCPQSLSPDLIDIIKEETNVKKIIISASDKLKATLDTTLTPELLAEGEYRDFVREIQVMRKNAGLLITDQISISAPSWPNTFEREILAKTLAVSVTKSNTLSIKKVNAS
ncbi:MAG: isoleucine--tRNA ligase [Patescibacteria group bacterium]